MSEEEKRKIDELIQPGFREDFFGIPYCELPIYCDEFNIEYRYSVSFRTFTPNFETVRDAIFPNSHQATVSKMSPLIYKSFVPVLKYAMEDIRNGRNYAGKEDGLAKVYTRVYTVTNTPESRLRNRMTIITERAKNRRVNNTCTKFVRMLKKRYGHPIRTECDFIYALADYLVEQGRQGMSWAQAKLMLDKL